MKKVLLLIISLFICQKAFAYQTVLVDFPEGQGWHAVIFDSIANETILQYVPARQNERNWTKTVIFHSYKNLNWTDSAAKFMDRTTMQLESKNATHLYHYTKYTEMDSIATRCINKNAYMPTQCEIYRVSKSFEGLISMHYINKNVQDYKNTYHIWYDIIKNVRIYYNYYMDDRILDKAEVFQL